MSQTYEEEIAGWAATWNTAEQVFQQADTEHDRARAARDRAHQIRNEAASQLLGCVGRNIQRRCVQLADGTLVIVDVNHGISIVRPIIQAKP
jgi:hypothetical protein